MMTKKNYLVAALIGLLVCLTVACGQEAASTPKYRDVLRELAVGKKVTYTHQGGAVWLSAPSAEPNAHTVSAVGPDFVALTREGFTVYIPIGLVVLRTAD